jgi:hypothetical protein
LEANTGFNVATAQGLKAFINQFYTYSQNFLDSAMSPNATSDIEADRFMFAIDTKATSLEKSRQIKLGFAKRGDGVKYATLKNGQLDPEFVAALTEGFQQRPRAVVYTDPSLGLKGINSTGRFTYAVLTPNGWKYTEFESYNQFVKSFSRTPVYGRNKLSDGTYVYTANPHLNIKPPTTRMRGALVVENESATKANTETPKPYAGDASLFDSFANSLVQVTPQRVSAVGTGGKKTKELTVGTLQEIYNFTPAGQRNGKTVLEIYDELTLRGHTYIPDGYNPFSRCL